MTLDALNQYDIEQFVAAVGWVFEHSPWVAERAWSQRPFQSFGALFDAMKSEVARADAVAQLALLRSHPDLGARARMSDASTGEQASVGLDRLNRDDFDRLQRQNAAYRAKFGFPFLYAVKGSGPAEILSALEGRLGADPATEIDEALRQVYRIAEFRLRDILT